MRKCIRLNNSIRRGLTSLNRDHARQPKVPNSTACALCTLMILMLSLSPGYAQSATSAGKIYRETETIVGLLDAIRAHLKIKNAPEAPPIQAGKQPIHLLSKTLELNESVAALQSKYNIAHNIRTTPLPLTEPTLDDVYKAVQKVKGNLRTALNKIGASAPKPKGGWALAKSPSDVYRQLAYAKNLVHTITGPVSQNIVYLHTLEILAEQKLIASKLSTELPSRTKTPGVKDNTQTPPAPETIDLNIQAQKNLIYTAFLQRKLKMDMFTIPEMNGAIFTTTDVDDTLRLILAELARIKVSLNIKQHATVDQATYGKSSTKASMKDILKQLHVSAENFEQLLQ